MRHGETDWNAFGLTQGSTDIPLNDTGRRQAADTGTLLAEEPWDALVASSLGRAIETAEIIGTHTGLSDIAVESRLVERGFGPAEGMRAEERKRMFPDKVIPGAETWEEVKVRTLEALEWIAAEYRGQRVIAVSHGGTILNVLAELSDGLYAPGSVVLENASMNLLEHDGERWRVRWCNRTTSPGITATNVADSVSTTV